MMIKIRNTISLMLFLSLGITANAQGRHEGQSTIHASYGLMPDETKTEKTAFMAKAGYGRVFGEKGFMGKAEAFYSTFEVGYTDGQALPYQRYGLNVQAGYSYEKLHPVYFNVYAGVFAGIETANDGKETDPLYNAPIPVDVRGFTYGLSGTAELEVFIIKNLSLTADYTQFYDLKSNFTKGSYAIFGGLKFYIN